MYEKYQDKVGFVIIDLSRGGQSREQKELVKKYYKGSIPHVVVLDASGNAVYNAPGEVEQSEMEKLLDSLLQQSSK